MNQSELIEFALSFIKIAYVEPDVLKEQITADVDDDIFLACALTVGAKYLVSGDHHLLDLGTWHDIQIVTVNNFLIRHFTEYA